MLALILSSLFFILLYRENRSYKGTTFLSVLLFLYGSSFAVSFIMSGLFGFEDFEGELLPSLYLLLIFYFWFVPYKGLQINTINCRETDVRLLAKIFIVILAPAFFYLFYLLIGILQSNRSNLEVLRDMLSEESPLPQTNLIFFYSIVTHLYFIPLLLFFYSVIHKWTPVFSILLLLSSLSFPVYCGCQFGRDGLVLWIFNVVLLYFILKNRFSANQRKLISRIGFVFLVIMVVLIGVITIQRFVNNIAASNNDFLIRGSLGYFGQQLGNFTDIFDFDAQGRETLFPFKDFILKKLGYNVPTFNELLMKKGLEDEVGVFGFFVRSLVFAYGRIGAIIPSLVFFAIINHLRKMEKRTHSIYYLLLLYMLFQIPLDGVFYYRQGINLGDLAYAFGFVIIYFVFKFNVKKQYA